MFMKAICLFLSRIKVLIWWIEGLSGLLFTFDYDLWSSDTNSRLRYNTRNKTDQKQIYKGIYLLPPYFLQLSFSSLKRGLVF